MYVWYFYFYATTVNIPTGIYTVDLFTWGLGFCNVMMKCSHETFYLSFLNVMLMQKSKYAKVKRIHAMLGSKYR